MILGINASRARSGGAVAHLLGILKEVDPTEFDISEIHVWSYAGMISTLPEAPWLIKHTPVELERSIFHQLWWEFFALSGELRRTYCSILLNVDAGSICRFRPAVTMSRDMLSYEPGEIQRYGISKARLRLVLLRYIQNASLKAADGVIFLTRHAAHMIQQSCGQLSSIEYIPHGVGKEFHSVELKSTWPKLGERPIRCLYISNVAPYKHQWHVVQAVAQLRRRGYDIELELIGGGKGKARNLLEDQIAVLDSHHDFVIQRGFVPHHTLPGYLAQADLFVFASSCENMPNTLVEAMASGLPIACAKRGPMPEVLADGGVYFDPEDSDSIASAIEDLITNTHKRAELASRAKELSLQYSWKRCASETFSFLAKTAKRFKKSN